MDCRWLQTACAAAAIAWALLGVCTMASASSCGGTRLERYVLACEGGACRGSFRVTHVAGYKACAMYTQVRDIDERTSAFLAVLVKEARPQATGLFELRFVLPYWLVRAQREPGGLIANLDSVLNRHDEVWPNGVDSAPPADVVASLDAMYPAHWLIQVSTDASADAVSAHKEVFAQTARREYVMNVLMATLSWASSLIVFGALIQSIHRFFFKLYAGPSAGRSRRVLAPIAVQCAIVAVVVGSLFLGSIEFWPGIVLIPAIVLLLPAEAWALFRAGRTLAAASRSPAL